MCINQEILNDRRINNSNLPVHKIEWLISNIFFIWKACRLEENLSVLIDSFLVGICLSVFKCLKSNCFVLQSPKFKFLVLLRYPYSDPPYRQFQRKRSQAVYIFWFSPANSKQVLYKKLVANLACLSDTGEYWPSNMHNPTII